MVEGITAKSDLFMLLILNVAYIIKWNLHSYQCYLWLMPRRLYSSFAFDFGHDVSQVCMDTLLKDEFNQNCHGRQRPHGVAGFCLWNTVREPAGRDRGYIYSLEINDFFFLSVCLRGKGVEKREWERNFFPPLSLHSYDGGSNSCIYWTYANPCHCYMSNSLLRYETSIPLLDSLFATLGSLLLLLSTQQKARYQSVYCAAVSLIRCNK